MNINQNKVTTPQLHKLLNLRKKLRLQATTHHTKNYSKHRKVKLKTRMTNLEKWNFVLRDLESPQIFIDWSFYYGISAALERRIWWGSSGFLPVFPNIFVVFIADPGVGKTLAADVLKKQIFATFDKTDKTGRWEQLIRRGPSSITMEALPPYMQKHFKTLEIPSDIEGVEAKIYTYSSIAFFAGGELGNLFKLNTHDLVRFLTEAWDCGDFHKETKTGGTDIVKNMSMALFGSATPDWMQTAMKSSLLNEGIAARIIFVYAGKSDQRKKTFEYTIDSEQEQMLAEIRAHILNLTTIYGEVDITPDVKAWTRDWYENRNFVLNPDRKLGDYYGRKKQHLMKMAMCVHFADSDNLTLTVRDCETALALLNATEMSMSKALQGTAENPLSGKGVKIFDFIESAGKASKKELLAQFWDELKQPSDLDVILDYLFKTDKIFESKLDKDVFFPVKKHLGEITTARSYTTPTQSPVTETTTTTPVKKAAKATTVATIEL